MNIVNLTVTFRLTKEFGIETLLRNPGWSLMFSIKTSSKVWCPPPLLV